MSIGKSTSGIKITHSNSSKKDKEMWHREIYEKSINKNPAAVSQCSLQPSIHSQMRAKGLNNPHEK